MKLSQIQSIARKSPVEVANDYDVGEYLSQRHIALTQERAEVITRAFSKGDAYTPMITSTSFGYGMQKFIADAVCPIIQGDVSRTFAKFKRVDRNAIQNLKIGSASQIHESDYGFDLFTYNPQPYGDKVRVDLNIVAQSPIGPDLFDAASATVMSNLLLTREYRVSQLFMAAANYATTGNTSALSSTARWDVAATSSTADPLKDINVTAKLALAVPANTIIASTPVLTYLRQHPKVVAAAGTRATDRVISNEELAKIFDVQQVIEASARYNSTGNAVTQSYQYLWGKGLWVGYVNPGAGKLQTAFAKTVRHTDLTFREEIDMNLGLRGVAWVIGSHEDAEVIAMEDTGYLLDTVIS